MTSMIQPQSRRTNIPLQIGQIWMDNDPRSLGERTVRILDLPNEEKKVLVEVVTSIPGYEHTIGKHRRIDLSQFNRLGKKGFSFVRRP